MIPTLLDLGFFKVRSYGLMMGLAFLLAAWILNQGLTRKHRRFPDDIAYEIILLCIVFGILGSKVFYLIDRWEDVRGHPWKTFFSSTGLTWYGGPITVIPVVTLVMRWRGLKMLPVLDAAAPALAGAYALGRVGCFLAGDGCYGVPTDLPWGIAFPHGIDPTRVPVHPTMLYETLWNAPLAFLLFQWDKKRQGSLPTGTLFAAFLALHGFFRFANEELRTNNQYLWGLTQAQFISLLAVAVGTVWFLALRSRPRVSA